MPATAGRVRMPANNRVHSSAALQTHGIWQSAIGYDPYAPTSKDDSKISSTQKAPNSAEPDAENAYASFQGLLALAKITNSNSDEARGACKRCGRVGHLYFQCRNFLGAKDGGVKGGKDDDFILEVVLEKLKGEKVKRRESSEDDDDEEEEDSETSDSEYDSEIERVIAERAKKPSGKVKVRSRRREYDEEKDKDDRREKRGRSKKREDDVGDRMENRGRSKKRRSGKRQNSNSEDELEEEEERMSRRKRRKEKRRRSNDDEESSDEEEERRRRKRKSRKERRRRSHRYLSDDDSVASPEDSRGRLHKRRSRRTASTSDSHDSDANGSDDPRVGRDKKRSDKKSRKNRREDQD